MLRLDEIRDPALLRQVAVLLELDNDKLHARLQVLTAELARLRGDATPVELDLAFLKELLAQRERALFGPSSERRPRPQPEASPPAPAPRRGHGPTAQLELTTIEVVHELTEADQICPQCGGTLKEMPGQTEDSEEIDVLERRFVLVKHQRTKYRCSTRRRTRCGSLRARTSAADGTRQRSRSKWP